MHDLNTIRAMNTPEGIAAHNAALARSPASKARHAGSRKLAGDAVKAWGLTKDRALAGLEGALAEYERQHGPSPFVAEVRALPLAKRSKLAVGVMAAMFDARREPLL